MQIKKTKKTISFKLFFTFITLNKMVKTSGTLLKESGSPLQGKLSEVEVDSAGAGFLKKGSLMKVVDGLHQESDTQLETTGLVSERILSF